MEEETVQITNTREETDRKCPACGGVMDFNPQTGRLKCPYCDHEEEITEAETKFEAQELDFASASEEEICDWGVATKTVICKACGAELVYDFNEMSTQCPYCGSNQVMEEGGKNIMVPGGVIPFRIEDQEASARFKRWIKGKFFCPKLAKESAKPEAFKGVYVPYWTFDAKTKSNYTGEYGIEKNYRDKEGNLRTEVTWHSTHGIYFYDFDDVLVCASTKQSASLVRGLEPYDTKQVVEYKPEYMAGFQAERYTVKKKDAWEKAKDIMHRLLKRNVGDKIEQEHNTTHSQNISLSTSYSAITYKYILLPIWISAFLYQGKVYHIMVNGQTGKVSGKTPISKWKVAFTILAVIVALILIRVILN